MAETAVEKSGKTGVSKMEAVRQVLAQLGKDAMPIQMQSVIKEKFGIEMSPDHISNYKSEILRKAGGKAKPAAPKAAPSKPAAPKAAPTPAAQSNGKSMDALSLKDVETVKTLLGRLGSTSLKGLIDVLAK